MKNITDSELEPLIKKFHTWVMSEPINEEYYKKSSTNRCLHTFSPYNDGNFTKNPKNVNNYMLSIETYSGDEITYDIFGNFIEMADGEFSEEYCEIWEVDLTEFDLTCIDEAAFQLSTAYDFGCSTESVKLLLEIVQLIRTNNGRLPNERFS